MAKEWYWVGVVRQGKRHGAMYPSPFPTEEPPGAYPGPDEWLGFATLAEASVLS
jgi:hypothetical protein